MENRISNGSRKIDPFVNVTNGSQSVTTPVLPMQYLAQPQPNVPAPLHPFIPRVQESNTNEECDIFDNTELIVDGAREHMKLLTIVDKVIRRNFGSMDSQKGVLLGGHCNTKNTAQTKLLSNGCVQLIRVYCPTDERGNKSPLQCEVEAVYREPIKRLSLPVDAIRRKDKSVQNVLASAGVVFIKDGFKIWCEKFSEQLSRTKVHTEHTGFYKDENDRWCHVNAGDIALSAVDSQGTLERLGIDFSSTSDDNFLRLTLFLYGVLGRIFTVIRSMNVFPMAMLAIVHTERTAALEDLKALYCTDDNPLRSPGKSFEKQIFAFRDEVVLVSLSGSDYMKKICLETLSQHESELTAIPLLISENCEVFSKRNDVLLLNYDLTGIGDINGELCWAVKTLLNEPSLSRVLPDKFDWWCTLLENDTETVGMRKLIALLLSLAQLYLPRLGVNSELIAVLQKYKNYLVNSAYSSSQTVVDRLKKFLTSRRDIPLIRIENGVNPNDKAIYLKGNMVLLSRLVFDYIAKKCGATRMSLTSILNSNGALRGNIGSNMRNIRFGDNTERMYSIDCSTLFDVGELRPMCGNNKASVPLYKIPIGTADNYDIYYDIYPSDGKKGNNPFALITGATGTGKSTLCRTLAVNAALLNLSVVNIGLNTSALDLQCNIFEPGKEFEVSVDLFFETLCTDLGGEKTDITDMVKELMLGQDFASYNELLNSFAELVKGEECAERLMLAARKTADCLYGFSWDRAVINGKISQVIAESPEEADKLLLDFFNYKAKQSETQYTLLLLDEVQDFSWDSRSPLVAKILRQGRKFGIVGIFSTQYLNADNGKNIASALKQIGTHFVFRPSDNIAALKQLDYKSSDTEARDVLNTLDTGEALARGNISTDICPVDYNIKISVNLNDLNDIL